jgi:ABC-type transporter MlaC component
VRNRLEAWLLSASVALALLPAGAAAWVAEPGYIPMRRDLPSGIDLLESSLYWLQDLSGVDDPRDPASIVRLMEAQAARFFDFAYMSYLIGGPAYTRLNVLERSHFQNRVRDGLFSMLARQMGMFDARIPRFQPELPVRTGLYTGVAGGEFLHRGGPYIRLRFHFYLSSRGWRIYDVTSNGVSAVRWLREKRISG